MDVRSLGGGCAGAQSDGGMSLHHTRKVVSTVGVEAQTVGGDHLWCARPPLTLLRAGAHTVISCPCAESCRIGLSPSDCMAVGIISAACCSSVRANPAHLPASL